MRSSALPAVFMVVCGSAFSAQPLGPDAAAPVLPTAVQTKHAATAPMGRMFFSPAQRAALDESRLRPVAISLPEPKPLPPPPEYVTLDGVVRRSDGATTVWINNRRVEGNQTAEGLEVANSKGASGRGNITVVVPQTGRSVDLRVGQQFEVTSGKVKERYELTPTAAVAAPEAAAPATETSATKPTLRRPAKERELLRELLHEIEGPAADRPDPPAAGKG